MGIETTKQKMRTSGYAFNSIEKLEDKLKVAEEDFHETALYSTEMVKCSIQATTATLERNKDITKKKNDEKKIELKCACERRTNNHESNKISENVEFEKSKEILS